MELAGRTLRERVLQALVLFVVLFAFEYVRNGVDWSYLLGVTAMFVVFTLLLDGVWERVLGRG